MEKDEGEDWEPVDTTSLGRATWTFLHTLAANYPKVSYGYLCHIELVQKDTCLTAVPETSDD